MVCRCPNCGEVISPDALLEWGGWQFDEAKRIVSLPTGKQFHISHKTSAILFGLLLQAKGRVVSKEKIFGVVYWRKDEDLRPAETIVTVYISRLRQDLRLLQLDQAIATAWGAGIFLHEFAKVPTSKPKDPRLGKNRWDKIKQMRVRI